MVTVGAIVALVLILVVATINVATVMRVWKSSVFQTSQKVAQTFLIWLVPGSAFLVRHVLSEALPDRSEDPTADNAGLRRF
jgi:hypothetical protein